MKICEHCSRLVNIEEDSWRRVKKDEDWGRLRKLEEAWGRFVKKGEEWLRVTKIDDGFKNMGVKVLPTWMKSSWSVLENRHINHGYWRSAFIVTEMLCKVAHIFTLVFDKAHLVGYCCRVWPRPGSDVRCLMLTLTFDASCRVQVPSRLAFTTDSKIWQQFHQEYQVCYQIDYQIYHCHPLHHVILKTFTFYVWFSNYT
jgi:hypothetical protein